MLNDIYGSGSQWLKAEDLQGAKPVVTIATAEVKENTYDGVVKKQIVLTFVGKEKQFGLNFTNASHLVELTGTEDYEQWVGTAIKLFTTKVQVGNEQKLAIRIFPELPEVAPKAKAATASANDDEEIPF